MGHKTLLKYIELKSGYNGDGPAWIARVKMSQSGRTVYFNGRALKQGSGGRGLSRSRASRYEGGRLHQCHQFTTACSLVTSSTGLRDRSRFTPSLTRVVARPSSISSSVGSWRISLKLIACRISCLESKRCPSIRSWVTELDSLSSIGSLGGRAIGIHASSHLPNSLRV